MRGLKHFTDGKRCCHTVSRGKGRSEAPVVTIGVGLNMASKRYLNVDPRTQREDIQLRFRCAKIDPNPKFHFEPFVHHYNGTFKSYRQQKNGSMGRVKGGYQQQIFFDARNCLENTPDFETQRIFRKGLFRRPPGIVPPLPFP